MTGDDGRLSFFGDVQRKRDAKTGYRSDIPQR
ncbi:hypothetical protein CpipJ_CPIJ020019 [Culex quinquefasciatus]|uniref:Uncharacterized protein n=1 Tax=Culex quinquefasciatus TaxID=7176 RepID=B0XLW7_CULQU|nr:hypothetical protein CpipJ_CPIJ020019 [Culex quinquefasciatus]|eukprot:XP_001870638.1 hypothetical protein CpipJ_CPIJ020019 [Culex quinquefasciatus]